MSLRATHRWLLAVLILFAVIGALVAFLVATPPGGRWLVARVDAAMGDQLRIGEVSGTLAEGLDLRGVEYRADGMRANVGLLTVRWRLVEIFSGRVIVRSLRAENVALTLPEPPETEKAASDQGFAGFDLPLPVVIDLREGVVEGLTLSRGDEQQLIDRIEAGFVARFGTLTVRNFLLSAPLGGVSGKAEISLSAPNRFRLFADWYGGRADNPDAAGNVRASGDLTRVALDHDLLSPLPLKTEGSITLAPELTGSLYNRLEAFSPAELGWGPVGSLAGTFSVQGGLDTFALTADFTASGIQGPGQEIPGGRLALKAIITGADRESGDLTLEKLSLATLGGQIDINGRLDWQRQADWRMAWQLGLAARDLNPAVVAPGWPGKLALRGSSEGRFVAGEATAAMQLEALEGELRGHRVRAAGNIDFAGDRLSSEGLSVSLGDNRLSLKGQAGEQLALDWEMNFPVLAQLWPGLSGNLKGKGKVYGSTGAPVATGSLSGGDLSYGEYAAKSAVVRMMAVRDRGTVSAAIEGEGLRLGQMTLEQLTLAGEGALDDHRLRLSAVSADGNLSMALQGGYGAGSWRGHIDQLQLNATAAGDWQQEAPQSLSLSSSAASLGSGCLAGAETAGTPARFCLQGKWDGAEDGAEGGAVSAAAKLENLSIARFNHLLPEGFQVEGLAGGTLQAGGTAVQPELDATLTMAEGLIRLRRKSDGEEDDGQEAGQYGWRNLSLTAGLREGLWQFNGETRIDPGGTLQAFFQLDSAGQKEGPMPDRAEVFSGTVKADIDDLEFVEALAPSLRDVTGRLRADLNVAGNWAAPAIGGEIVLSEGRATVPALGLKLEDIQLALQGEQQALGIRGSLRSGKGVLEADGGLHYAADQGWGMELRVRGDRFTAAQLSNFEAWVSPDLSLVLERQLLTVTGQIAVPKANVTVETLPETAVSVSPDTIWVNGPDSGQGAAVKIASDVALKLGDEVEFKGFGLDLRLAGDMEVLEEPGKPRLSYGEVQVAEGTYKAFGENLNIERGKLVFQGPTDNPALDLRVVRKVPDFTVGLDIGGTLKQPRSRVYSEPPLPDGEAMAILVTGKPLSQASEQDADALVNAVAALGIERGQFITDYVADMFGLDKLSIESNGGLEESSLLLGKYLSPSLYVRYSLGLFDQLSKVGFNYRINKNLSLDAESGSEQSLDILYTIER